MTVAGPRGGFLIGSGPSLRETPVSHLIGYTTISFNRSFIAFDSWGMTPTYFAAFDPLVVEDNVQDFDRIIQSGSIEKVFLNECARACGIRPSPSLQFVKLIQEQTFIAGTSTVGDLGNVGASSLQLLCAMGFGRIVLLGIDGRYQSGVVTAQFGDTVLVAEDNDHFSPLYGKGKRRRAVPDFAWMAHGWEVAAKACKKLGVDVRNASPGSAVKCFEAISFEEALTWVPRSGEQRL